jgi:hypothetical protein
MFVAMLRRRCIVKAATIDRRALGFEEGEFVEAEVDDEVDGRFCGESSGRRRSGLVSEARVSSMMLDRS